MPIPSPIRSSFARMRCTRKTQKLPLAYSRFCRGPGLWGFAYLFIRFSSFALSQREAELLAELSPPEHLTILRWGAT